jgi:hypothetical protein
MAFQRAQELPEVREALRRQSSEAEFARQNSINMIEKIKKLTIGI